MKKQKILTALSLGLFSTLLSTSVLAEPQTINVYTYDSFTADWGAGPKVKNLFETQYSQCKVNYVSFDSSGTLLNRVRLEGKKTKADIVLGLDNYVLEEAKKSGVFASNKVDLAKLDLPITWKDQTFLPYDFGEYAFIYDKTKLANPPKSLKELVDREDLRVIYQDPRTSSVGRGLVVWLNQVYPQNEIENAWKKLAKHTVTVGKGWSATYGAFLKGESDLVLSYNTSPLYHLLNEQKDQYVAANLAEGGVLQIELAARVVGHNSICADQFMQFLIEPAVQSVLAQNNVMLPVISAATEPHFDALKAEQMKKRVFDPMQVNDKDLKNWVKIWQSSLSH
ncbi:thiamine transport system substrate-binding protein [Bisgaardia hudsonensis]|uniref:Thiamine transport system substrate-binding protein n=1 Tax=Bisgaardia hudsonensis TaxID=109472 RepID=A0A4R2N2L8_9PAST|nr:thiamine transport system substrate-binding protein [Bisgaardia hudsonensis]